MKYLANLSLYMATALLILEGCATKQPTGANAPTTRSIKDQCHVNASNSAGNCEFMNQGNPDGLAECRKNKILADNRCERLVD